MIILIVSSIDIQLIDSFKYWYEDLSDIIIILSNKFYYDYDRDEIFIFYYPIPPLEIKNETLYTIKKLHFKVYDASNGMRVSNGTINISEFCPLLVKNHVVYGVIYREEIPIKVVAYDIDNKKYLWVVDISNIVIIPTSISFLLYDRFLVLSLRNMLLVLDSEDGTLLWNKSIIAAI